MNDEVQLREAIERVEAFEIDPGDKSLSFVDRLARENRWSTIYAQRVVTEYKRFALLAMHAGHPVTPSEQVDQAWHLHLTYTRSYWNRFCEQTLGKPLHHDPTSGGAVEGSKFRQWYSATLASYQRVFGCEPPSDIWPSVEVRFEHGGKWQWVNVGNAWIIPKRTALAALTVLLVVCIVGLVAGCQPNSTQQVMGNMLVATLPPFNLTGAQFLGLYWSLMAIALIVQCLAMSRDRQQNDPVAYKSDPIKLTKSQTAVLTGGASRLLQVKIAELFSDGHIQAAKDSSQLVAIGDGPRKVGLGQEIFSAVRQSDKPNLVAVVRPYYEKITKELIERNLRYASRWRSSLPWWLLFGMIGFGLLRVLQGLSVDRPVGYLVTSMVIYMLVAILLNYRSTWLTTSGESLVAQLHKQSSTAMSTIPNPHGLTQSTSQQHLWNVALLGSVALVGIPEFDGLQKSLQRCGKSENCSSGCGSGCGYSGCGSSGGGGCGGGGCGGGGCGGCGGS